MGFWNSLEQGTNQGLDLSQVLAARAEQKKLQALQEQSLQQDIASKNFSQGNSLGFNSENLGLSGAVKGQGLPIQGPSRTGSPLIATVPQTKVPNSVGLGLIENATFNKSKQSPTNMGMTPGRKAADMAFGKDYVEWQQGGNAKAAQHLAGLGDAIKKYDSDKNMGGGIVGQFPDFVMKAVRSELPEVKQQVASTIQESMRQILGAQFTENEGKRIIANAFDPAISHQENMRRLTALHQQLNQAAEAKQKMADYFEQNGTLTGYNEGTPQIGETSNGGLSPEKIAALKFVTPNDPRYARVQKVLQDNGVR